MPYHRLYFSAIAMRSAELPQVTAYWFTLPWIAAHAASFIGSGIGKSGNPCARFTASCWFAMRVISRMTDSVKVCVRRAASMRYRLRLCSEAVAPSGERLGVSATPDLGERCPDQLGRRHPLRAAVDRGAHGLLGVRVRVAE